MFRDTEHVSSVHREIMNAEILVPRMHFIHRMIEESSVHINIIYYEDLPEPVLVYFGKTQADIMYAGMISALGFFASVKLPFEIKSAALSGRWFCMWTAHNFLVYCELLRSLEFKEVARVDLCHFRPVRNVIYSFRDAVVLVESQGARCFSIQSREIVISTKHKVVDVTFSENLMHAIETDCDKAFLCVYEVCVDMTLHRSMVEVERTSYLIALGRRCSYVFFVGGMLVVKEGKVHSSIELPHERIRGYSFSSELASLFVLTGNGSLSVIFNDNNLEYVENIGSADGLFLFGRYLLTFGLQSRIYSIELNGKHHIELFGDVGARRNIVLKRQNLMDGAAENAKTNNRLCEHEYHLVLHVYRSNDSFLGLDLEHICVENRWQMPALDKSRCPSKSIFVGESGVALLRGSCILIYSISDDILRAERLEKVSSDASGIMLFKDNGFLVLYGGAGTSISTDDLYTTHTEDAVYWYTQEAGNLRLVKHRKFEFRIDGLVVHGKFSVLHSGAVLWVFDFDIDAFVFVQILDDDIGGCFIENTFVYVLTGVAVVSIYKMDDSGRMELPIRISLEERYVTVKNGIVHAEKRLYLFVGYDFISLDTPKDTHDMRFHKNTLYIHAYSSFSAFRVVLEERMYTECKKSENKHPFQYSTSSGMYVTATPIRCSHESGYKDPNSADNGICGYRIAITNNKVGSTVHVYNNSNLISYRDFNERVGCVVIYEKNVICALPFLCMVFVIGKKQLVAKSQVRLPSEICDMQKAGKYLYVRTRLHSVFKYSLSHNTLVLVCSDVLNRRISAFKVLTENLVVFSDMLGFIGILEEKGHTYETMMSWDAGEVVTHFRAEHRGIIYETASRKVGELICVERELFFILETVYFHLFVKHHGRNLVKYEYPVVNALPACFEMSGLIADNLCVLDGHLKIDSHRLCTLLKLVYGSWMMKQIL